nr:hypothetical protein [Tanacetum cinerariifolium]GFB74350.1 hypothetical protein [Tanacetum cinerariifolium]
MMQLVPVEEIYVEALQVKHLIIDWKVHTEGQRSYWKIIRLRGTSASYQLFVDMLKHLDREDLNQLWELVKETLSVRPTTIEWKLYDTCRVHHVTSKDKEIFLLVQKDYPLRKEGIPTGSDEFPLPEQLPTANENKFPLQIQSDATVKKITQLLKSRNNCQSKTHLYHLKTCIGYIIIQGMCPMIAPRF